MRAMLRRRRAEVRCRSFRDGDWIEDKVMADPRTPEPGWRESAATPPSNETIYDSVPYLGHVHSHTHPNRVAAIAHLFGIDAPSVATARVLEVACGHGGNLIPIAYSLPHAHCVGFDLAATAVARSQQRITQLGLKNCQIITADLTTVGKSLGEFDYVIAHGLYSWVPAPLRDSLLQLISDTLSPTGVAFVSYNVYPGWHIAGMVRDMLRFHTREIDDPAARVAQSNALMKFISAAHEAEDPYGRLLAAECERLSGYPPWYLIHDDLATVNDPVYFRDFVAHAKQFDLGYLAEADFASMSGADLSDDAREKLDELRGDAVLHGQYLDFIKCRRFRQSLLCHATNQIAPAPINGRIQKLLVASAANTQSQPVDLAAGIEVQFQWSRASLKTEYPLAKAAFVALAEHWPQSMSVDALLGAAARLLGREMGEEDAAALEYIIVSAFGLRMVDITTDGWRAVNTPGDHPKASALARLESESDDVLTSLIHRRARVEEPSARQLLRLCDGSRDRRALLAELCQQSPGITDDVLRERIKRLALLGVYEA
jgi:SAM-dependent methyltransferase